MMAIGKRSTIELIKPLSKQELLALFQERGLLFRITPRDIIMAKINVLIENSDSVFGQWNDYQLPAYEGGIDRQIEYLKELKKKEGIFKKYELMQRKIDSLFRKLDTERD